HDGLFIPLSLRGRQSGQPAPATWSASLVRPDHSVRLADWGPLAGHRPVLALAAWRGVGPSHHWGGAALPKGSGVLSVGGLSQGGTGPETGRHPVDCAGNRRSHTGHRSRARKHGTDDGTSRPHQTTVLSEEWSNGPGRPVRGPLR